MRVQLRSNTLSSVLRLVSRCTIPVTVVVFLVPFLILLLYSLPATDDFCKATLTWGPEPPHTVLSITWLYYTQWSARWLTTFIQSLVMSSVELTKAYGSLLLFVIVSNVAALWYFFRTVARVRARTALLAALVFYCAYLASLPDLPQELYWLTGAIEYNLSLSSLLVLVSLLLEERRGVLPLSGIVVLSIAIPAQHEIAGMFLWVVLASAVVVLTVKRRPARQWFVSLAIASISLGAVVLSPGNSVRAVQQHRRLWDIQHLPAWLGHGFYHGLNWASYPAILVAAGCIVVLCQSDSNEHASEDSPRSWLSMGSLYLMFLLLCEVSFVEMATGTWVPYRVGAWFEFIFWLLFVCMLLIGAPEIRHLKLSNGKRLSVFALMAVTLLGSANFRSAVEDLRGPVQAWWRLDSSRLQQRGGVLEFTGPARYPKLTFHQNLSKDSGCFVNQCLARYLGAHSVVVTGDPDECPGYQRQMDTASAAQQ